MTAAGDALAELAAKLGLDCRKGKDQAALSRLCSLRRSTCTA